MPNDQVLPSVGQAIARSGSKLIAEPIAPAPTETAPPKAAVAASVPDPALVKRATEQINEFIRKSTSSSLQFSVDKTSGRIIVKVVDQETGDVIRQIPSEETLAIASNLDAHQGVIIQSKA